MTAPRVCVPSTTRTYYGAFVMDPNGHNIEAVCHTPASQLKRASSKKSARKATSTRKAAAQEEDRQGGQERWRQEEGRLQAQALSRRGRGRAGSELVRQADRFGPAAPAGPTLRELV